MLSKPTFGIQKQPTLTNDTAAVAVLGAVTTAVAAGTLTEFQASRILRIAPAEVRVMVDAMLAEAALHWDKLCEITEAPNAA